MSEFDQRFGTDFLAKLPLGSGVYLFRDAERQIIYVGKAKNLRRRLSQYRLAKARKKSRKMRLIVRHAASLEIQVCADEDEALLLENRLIQSHRPRFNIAGAFSFLYPYIACGRTGEGYLCLAYATDPNQLVARDWEAFGAFRSREIVKAAYDALLYLGAFLAHPDPRLRAEYGDIPYTRLTIFRQWPERLDPRAFFHGESADLLAGLFEELLEKPGARRHAAEVQEQMGFLRLFFETEARALRDKLRAENIEASMIPQNQRDPLFLRGRK